MRLLGELPWPCWILPGLLVAVWLLLWLAPVRGRTRMRFASMAPVVSVAGLVIGVITMVRGGGSPAEDVCAGPQSCASGGHAAHWAYGLASVSEVGLAIVANALIGGGISLLLLVITAVVELPRAAGQADRSAAR